MFKEIKAGNILIKMAETEEEKYQAYRLRYFSLILDYNKNATNKDEIDKDEYDDYCDHLIAIDTEKNIVVGTYRLIRYHHIHKFGKFLTEREFNINNIKNKDCDILEVGRAVVKEEYRDGSVIILLWKAVTIYFITNKIRYLIGTASFHGVNTDLYKECFSYLYYNCRSAAEVLAYADTNHRCDLNILKEEEIDKEKIQKELPPLVKGYLRLGATIGNDAYVDVPFNSIDILILLDAKDVNPKYVKRFVGEV